MSKSTTAGNIRTREVSEPMSKETYEPNWVPVRPGAQDHEVHPSRRGDTLVYRDGRVEVVA